MPKPAVNAAERTRDKKPSKFALSPRKNETNADQQPKAISGKARISDEAARISCGTVGALCFRAVEAHGQNGRRRFPVLAGVETGSPTPAHRAQSAHVFGEISLPPSLPPSFLSYVPLLNSFSHSLPSAQRPLRRARRPYVTRTAGLRPPAVVSSLSGLPFRPFRPFRPRGTGRANAGGVFLSARPVSTPWALAARLPNNWRRTPHRNGG